MWPLALFGVAGGAYITRTGYRLLKHIDIAMWKPKMPIKITWMHEGGFEVPMSRNEALRILNLNSFSSANDIRQAHRLLMLRNHPDSGGSNYVASKVNQAKDIVIGKKK
eukprot:GHVR01185259.1.p1 GENE.GHVR01185259.1~~GHVR01185259.1.p1  ORF type:complete len:109 (+),score=19.49 GHVR01185259.1:29-355(+)